MNQKREDGFDQRPEHDLREEDAPTPPEPRVKTVAMIFRASIASMNCRANWPSRDPSMRS